MTDPGSGISPGGTLYVVATPIGNLADVTLRALETLRAVTLIAAEDTRISRRLLARHGVATRLVSYHAKSGPGREAELLAHLRGGAALALISDAGTPLVSDPGEGLVAAWAREGGTVVAIPGPSAVLAAVASSGLAGPRWTFEGFLPRSGSERRARLAAIAADGRGAVLFEAPTRLAATLRDLAAACGPDRPGAVCRELTKLHEQVARGGLGELAAAAGRPPGDGGIPARGEVVIVVGWAAPAHVGAPAASDGGRTADLASARAEVEALVAGGLRRSDAAKRLAAETGLDRRLLYGTDPAR